MATLSHHMMRMAKEGPSSNPPKRCASTSFTKVTHKIRKLLISIANYKKLATKHILHESKHVKTRDRTIFHN